MKKNNRELKGLAKRGLAIVLCCLCLLATVPVSAMAQETAPTAAQEETPAAGGEQMENPQGGTGEESPQPLTEEIPEGKTVPTTQNVTPITTETTTTPNTETTTTPNTETTTTPSTETTTTPSTETTTTPSTETTTTPNTKTTAPTIPVLKNPGMVTANLAAMPENDINLAAIGGKDSITLKIGESATITSNVTDTSANSDHRESWVSDNEAVAKVEFDLDDEDKAASATVTGVSAGTATITHTYYTSQDYLGGLYTYWTTHTETIQVTVSAQEYTVTFSVGEEAAAAGVVVPSPVTVLKGETVSDLPTLSWIGEDGQPAKVFAGWYTDEALTNEFTTGTAVNSNTTLYASWVEPDAEGVYYVNFYSQDGRTVHLTLSAAEGRTVVPAQGPTLVGKVFKGWSTTMQGDSSAANLDAFDFTKPVSDAATDGTLNLYAWYAKSVTVSFIANGGKAVPSQIIAEGDTATSGQTTRTGYTFRGWSTDKDSYTAFDFGTHINEDLTLYAFWDANLVPVTIVYMYENPNDAEYSPAGKSAKIYAPAGSYVSIEKSSITNLNGSHAVRYADTMEGALTGYAKQTTDENGDNATIPDISDTYYQYDHASNKRWVNPDGSTTVLVYYNRARVTLTFSYESTAKGSIAYTDLISEANREKYDVKYSSDEKTGNYGRTTYTFNYSFTAKYGEDITAVWPQVGWVKDNSGNTPSYKENGYTYTFYAWDPPTGNDQSSNMYTLEANLFGNNSGLSIVKGKLVGTGTLSDVFKAVYKDWLIYARTTLPGETVDFIYGGKNYTIYKEACQLGYTNAGYFGYKSLNGCTPVNSKLTLLDQYGSSMSIDDLFVNTGSSLKEKFDATFPKQISENEICQVLLYDRSTLTLNVWTKDDTHSATDPQKEAYLYGDKIYNEDTDLLKSLKTTMTRAGYVFAGWYTASEFTPGTEYKPDENSTITANMNLYAKWEPNQFRAEYYLYMDDATPYAWQGFAEGGKIDDKLVPSAVQDSFLGWYWYQNGQLVRFDFTSAVGASHVDEKGVLKLYAKWNGNNGKVSYLPGIGGDNANQEVVDERDFAINDASVQLKQHTEVWSSGVPNDTSLTFVGWKAPNGVIYQPGRYVLVTRNLMQFEAQWSKDAVRLIYDANGGKGDNVTEYWARNSVVSIWDNMDGTTPHFTREGYTLLGWDENKAATTPTYKLGQGSITLENEVTTLYAIWEKNTVTLTIKKTVSGNMYNANDEFKFNINFGESTKVFTLKANAETTFEVPVNANVTVIETDSKGYTEVTVNDDETSDSLNVVKPENSDSFTFMMPDEDATLVINNDKTVKVDTGVSLETLPYILILGVVAVGVVLMVRRRRHGYDD